MGILSFTIDGISTACRGLIEERIGGGTRLKLEFKFELKLFLYDIYTFEIRSSNTVVRNDFQENPFSKIVTDLPPLSGERPKLSTSAVRVENPGGSWLF